MSIFEKFAKKAAVKKIEKTVDDNWDAILNVFGVIVGVGIFFGSRKDGSSKTSSPTYVNITYNYYGRKDKNEKKKRS